jgi:hypothetical protein
MIRNDSIAPRLTLPLTTPSLQNRPLPKAPCELQDRRPRLTQPHDKDMFMQGPMKPMDLRNPLHNPIERPGPGRLPGLIGPKLPHTSPLLQPSRPFNLRDLLSAGPVQAKK